MWNILLKTSGTTDVHAKCSILGGERMNIYVSLKKMHMLHRICTCTHIFSTKFLFCWLNTDATEFLYKSLCTR